MIENTLVTRRKRIGLALSGKLDLGPGYAVIAFTFVISYLEEDLNRAVA